MKIELIAKICHQANKAYSESFEDFSHMEWEETPHNIKQSAMDGVKFFIDNPTATPEMSHENWTKFKVADGWVYGEEKNLNTKTHPCLVPYQDLPKEQRVKDSLFIGIIKALTS